MHSVRFSVILLFCTFFFAHSSISSAALTTCIDRPASTLNYSSTDCAVWSPSPGVENDPDCVFSVPGNGSFSQSVPTGNTCTNTRITCTSPANISAQDTLIYDGSKVWMGGSCVPIPPPTGVSATCNASNQIIISGTANATLVGETYPVRVNNTTTNSAFQAANAGGCIAGNQNGDYCVDNGDGFPQTFNGIAGNTYAIWVHTLYKGGWSTAVNVSATCPAASTPTVTTNPATLITNTTATLNGTGNPNGQTTTASFRWGTSNVACSSLPNNVTATPSALGSGGANVPFSYNLTGLSSGTTYYYCAQGTSVGGTGSGVVLSFITHSPDLTVGSVSPTAAVVGTQVTFTANVSNIGTAGTGVGFNYFYQYASAINGGGTITDIPASSMGPLSAGGGANATWSVTPTAPGPGSVQVCADKTNRNTTTADDSVNESNEGNNCSGWTNVMVSCPSGQLADTGSAKCVSGTISATPANTCAIAAGGTQCSLTIVWDTVNGTAGGQTGVYTTTGTFSTNQSSVGQVANWVSPNSETLTLRSFSGLTLDTVNVSATCTNSTWNGTSCVPTQYPLTATVSGPGSVSSNPAGISACTQTGGTCSANYNSGTVVTLTATPVANSTFSGWSGTGGCTGTGTCQLTMSAARAATATFVCNSGYTQSGNSCTAMTIDVTAPTPVSSTQGSAVNLSYTVTPSSGTANCALYDFAASRITATTTGLTTGTYSVAVPSANTLAAGSYGYSIRCVLGSAPQVGDVAAVALNVSALPTLTATVSGPGSVSSNPAGISACTQTGGTCSANYNSGTVVTLTATPVANSTFSGWSGTGGCTGTGTCQLTMSAARAATATFVCNSGYTPSGNSCVLVGQAPTVSTNAATSITSTTATLNGTGNPNGQSTTATFRGGTTNGTCASLPFVYTASTPASGALGSGSSNVAFNYTVSGLSPSTTYYFCAEGTNSTGTGRGSVLSFTTPASGAVPVASISVNPTPISYNTATTLTWSSTNSPTSCTAGGAWGHSGNFSGSGSSGNLTSSQTYTFQCTNAAGTSNLASATVTVCPQATPNWNGSSCVSGPAVTLYVPDCAIPLYSSTCTVDVYWTSQNLTHSLSVRQNGSQFSTASNPPPGTFTKTLQYGSGASNTFTAIHNGSTLATEIGAATCASGSWISNQCQPAPMLPDFTFGNVSPVTANANLSQTFSATFTNLGPGTAASSINYLMQQATAANGGGTITDEQTGTVANTSAGGTRTASEVHTFPSSGTYSLRFCADKLTGGDSGLITEVDEDNNCGGWTNITVGAAIPSANLTVGNCTIAIGASSCRPTVSWTSSNVPAARAIYRNTAPSALILSNLADSGSLTSGQRPTLSAPGSYTFSFRGNGTTYDTDSSTASCATNSSWNGTTCAQITHLLSTTVVGGGSVSSNPTGIDACTSVGGTCSANFNAGTSVTLTATPVANSTFSGWSGTGGCTGTGTCQLTMSAARAATATFICDDGYTLTAGVCTPNTYPDLTAEAISPTTVIAGQSTVLSATIRNIGTGATGQSFNNFIQWSSAPNGNGTITDLAATNMADLASLATAVTSQSVTFPTTGTVSARACADASNASQIGVINEPAIDNNCGPWTDISVVTPVSAGILIATPDAINYGNTTTLSWSGVAGATSCSLSGGQYFNVDVGTSPSGSRTTNALNEDTLYTLTCLGYGGPVTSQALVSVASGNISAAPTSCTINTYESTCQVGISWTTFNMQEPRMTNGSNVTLSINPDGTGVLQSVSYGNNTFAIKNGSITHDSVLVNAVCESTARWTGSVCSPGVATINSASCVIAKNASSCINDVIWSTSNPAGTITVTRPYDNDSIFATGASGDMPASFTSGTFTLEVRLGSTVLASGTYNATCEAGSVWIGGVCQETTNVTLGTLYAVPSTVDYGEPTTLSWNGVANATGCTLSGGEFTDEAVGVDEVGTIVTSPLTDDTTYTLTCTGPGGPKSSSVTVKVASGNLSALPFSCTILTGESSCGISLNWTTSNMIAPNVVDPLGEVVSTSPSETNFYRNISEGNSVFSLKNANYIHDAVTVSASCEAGSTWDGTLCSFASGSLNSSSCVIAIGQSHCSPRVIWSMRNPTQPVTVTSSAALPAPLTNPLYSGASGDSASKAFATYGVNTLNLLHGTEVIATGSYTATCATGSVWNSTTELCLPSGVSGNLMVSSKECFVPVGASTCTVTGTWTTSGVTNPSVINETTNLFISDQASQIFPINFTVGYPNVQFVLREQMTPGVYIPLDFESVSAKCIIGGWDTLGAKCANPIVVSARVTGQYYSPVGSVAVICSNANGYRVVRTSNGQIMPGPLYPGSNQEFEVTVSVSGNYAIYCLQGNYASLPTVVYYNSSPPPPPTISISATPRTISVDSDSTVSWTIQHPRPTCDLTARTVCSNGLCTADQEASASSINTIIRNPNSYTDAVNSTYANTLIGGVRTIAQSLKYIPAERQDTDWKTEGRKTFNMKYSTEFVLSCGDGNSQTVRIQVTRTGEQ